MAQVEFTVLDEFVSIYIISRGMKHIKEAYQTLELLNTLSSSSKV